MAKDYNPIIPPPPPGKPGGLGEKIESTIERIALYVYNHTIGPISERVRGGVDSLLEEPREQLNDAAGPLLAKIKGSGILPPEVDHLLNEVTSTEPISLTIILSAMVLGVVGGIIGGIMAPISRLLSQWLDSGIESARAEPGLAWPITWRNPAASQDMLVHMKQLGWDEDNIDQFATVLRPRVTPWDLYRLWHLQRRAGGSDPTLELKARGYLPTDIEALRDLSYTRPGPADLVRMAVRGAFSPAEIAEFNLGAEFPGEFGTRMEELGFGEDEAKRYWYAHWELPSIQMAFSMYHRGVIDRAALELLLKAQDVSPFWRDKLTAIAHTVLTRVDVRRMYGMGVLSRDEVTQSYLSRGYSPTDAERMTEFTIRYESSGDRELTKADILGGVRDGMLSSGEGIDWLVSIGYNEDTAGYLVARETAKTAKKLQDKQIKEIKTLFIQHRITEAEARGRLTTLNISSGEIDQYLQFWSVDRAAKTKRASRGELDRMLVWDVVTEADYRTGLDALGYDDGLVERFTRLILEEKAKAAQRETESARREQQRLADTREKEAYRVDKAELDVLLAEIATAIAESQIALGARSDRYQIELEIARKRLSEAELSELAQADIDRLDSEVDDLEEARSLLKEQIDAWQTSVADIKLQQVEYAAIAKAQMEAAVSDEEIARIEAEIAQRVIGFERGIREYQLLIEQAQDDIASLNTQILARRRAVSERRVRLRQEIAVVERVANVEELRQEYTADISTLNDRLVSLRIDQSLLKEQKAQLRVGHLAALAA